MNAKPLKIFLIAGEASGDILGAGLMASLKAEYPGNISFAGVGGMQMQAQGLQSLFPMEELSIMGLAEVLPKLPLLIRRINETSKRAIESKPDAIVTIDSPDFCFRVIKKLRKSGIKAPFIHYVAPSVWAWRPRRAKKLAKLVDHVLALLPFEPPYFEKEGLGCTFVGHLVTETIAPPLPKSPDTPKNLVLLPGSRVGEISRLLPVFIETAKIIRGKYPDLTISVPTLPHLVPLIGKGFEGSGLPLKIVTGEVDKRSCFLSGDVALAASGTVALELAAAGLPSVIGYRMNALTSFLAKKLVKTAYVSLVNIVLGRQAIPELLLERCTPDLLSMTLLELLENPAATEKQRADYKQALALLSPGMSPNVKAAQTVLSVIATGNKS